MKLFSVSEQTCDVFGHVSPDLNTETRMKLDVEVKRLFWNCFSRTREQEAGRK